MPDIQVASLLALLAPLAGVLLSLGALHKKMSPLRRAVAVHASLGATMLVGLSFVMSLILAFSVYRSGYGVASELHWFDWARFSNELDLKVLVVVDRLSVFMMLIVTFISFWVHLYSVAYMRGERGYGRFFVYLSGFTFSMLLLVMAGNLLLLFFGWEGVGLFSYLLIGFHFERPRAVAASLRAFLINRIGDLGFLVGIAALFYYFGTLNYHALALKVSMGDYARLPIHFFGYTFSPFVLISGLLLIGCLGKSAQIPLHTWLEGSMEGPTPISALIHAATMVTAGVFVIARLSFLFSMAPSVLTVVMIIGAATCLLMGLVALVQTDIKHVIAYCTLSQLGYMMAAAGASAFSLSLFHLLTHAFFKALLFLAAGSVILALHHEQNMEKMGGLWKKLPFTYVMMIIGAAALSAIPPFAGFYSKDVLIEAVHAVSIPLHDLAYVVLVIGSFITPLYIFRMVFMTFHGEHRGSPPLFLAAKEPSWLIRIPLLVLSIAALVSGALLFPFMLGSSELPGETLFGLSLSGGMMPLAMQQLDPLRTLAASPEMANPWTLLSCAWQSVPVWLAVLGILSAWLAYVRFPRLPLLLSRHFFLFRAPYLLLKKKYGFDFLYDRVIVTLVLGIAKAFWVLIDRWLIDKCCVHGLAWIATTVGRIMSRLQRGMLADYALLFAFGLLILLGWVVWVS